MLFIKLRENWCYYLFNKYIKKTPFIFGGWEIFFVKCSPHFVQLPHFVQQNFFDKFFFPIRVIESGGQLAMKIYTGRNFNFFLEFRYLWTIFVIQNLYTRGIFFIKHFFISRYQQLELLFSMLPWRGILNITGFLERIKIILTPRWSTTWPKSVTLFSYFFCLPKALHFFMYYL